MTLEHAIEFAESGQSTGGQTTYEAFEVLVSAVRNLQQRNAELESIVKEKEGQES